MHDYVASTFHVHQPSYISLCDVIVIFECFNDYQENFRKNLKS